MTAGTVQFADDGIDDGSPVPLNASGQAQLSTSTLGEGTHAIRATYLGSTGFLTSNESVSQRVDTPTVINGHTFCNPGGLAVPSQGPSSRTPPTSRSVGWPGPWSTSPRRSRGCHTRHPLTWT